jgi:acetyl-CoA carboxylase biotin carboxylase subunit
MQKVLIANRGEIALRIMKTLKKMGIQTVAIYSEADRNAPHTLFADESICIGPPASSSSYLQMDKIIASAISVGAEGIHPGYGFLSENAFFAEKVENSGLTFIGPRPSSIEIMGSKLAAKETVAAYGIPLVPGTKEAITDIEEGKKIAHQIGYPILIKASAGGGGKGMRTVERDADFEESFQRAQSEAKASFGDDAVFIEKYVASPRHIEVQILSDTQGNHLYLFERECSIQRRHQKVVEEAPSSVLTPSLREAMGIAAVKVAESCNYRGAGTVEFLLDDSMNFYFLEMNTRLQVEHPVTEMITGLDLVEWQIRIARGEPLPMKQEDLSINGHSIELRVYAEDPYENFLPSIGTLEKFIEPNGEGIRVDSGYYQGMQIPIYYDPMISKLIVHGKTREAAIQKMKEAIVQYEITGCKNTLDFGRFVMEHPAFVSGKFDTHFVSAYFSPKNLEINKSENRKIAALMAAYLHTQYKERKINSNAEDIFWTKR